MQGTVVKAEEVKARWAYCEITSDRFGKTYRKNLSATVYDGAINGVPFDQVPQSEWPALIAALKLARNPGFIDNIDAHGAPKYECVEWSISDLLNCQTLPCFDQVPYIAFIARPPGKDVAGNPDNADPRFKGHHIPFDSNFRLEEPLIAIMVGGRPMLIEGYLRSILWLRNPSYPLRVWIPKL